MEVESEWIGLDQGPVVEIESIPIWDAINVVSVVTFQEIVVMEMVVVEAIDRLVTMTTIMTDAEEGKYNRFLFLINS